jgi:hypothetical protein
MSNAEAWYVVKQPDGHCEIVAAEAIAPSVTLSSHAAEKWGPFASQGEAVARRVGLIRAGKCQPV